MGLAMWYVKRDGRILGPYSSKEVRRMVTAGTILPSDKLRKSGTRAWRRAGRSRKLFPQPGTTLSGEASSSEFGIDDSSEVLPAPRACAAEEQRAAARCFSADPWRVGPAVEGDSAADKADSRSPVADIGSARRQAVLGSGSPQFEMTMSLLLQGAQWLAKAGVMACGVAGLWWGYEHRAVLRHWVWPPPFPLLEVQGQVSYEDGAALDCPDLFIAFHSSRQRLDSRTYPRTAHARVDPRTGGFRVVDDGRAFGGVVAGPHRVTLHVGPPGRMPAHVASEVYEDVRTTPLEIEVDGRPLRVQIQRPPAAVITDEG